MSEQFHIPVLLDEVLSVLQPQPGETYVDGTLGGGGHALAIAQQLGPKGTVVGIDLDPQAIASTQQKFAEAKVAAKTLFFHGSYADIDQYLSQAHIQSVDCILVDFGISSYDIDASGRGFSFQKDEPLDMRFNPEEAPGRRKHPETAADILRQYQERDLEKVFREFGEEKFSRKIARAIVAHRQEREIATTTDLFELIKKALPAPLRYKAADSARRIFQALRIEVNHELENIERFLPKAFEALAPGGRLAVISFHSLEDRIVKRYFAAKSKGCICPPDFPECRCGRTAEATLLTRKPLTADEGEQQMNLRSKPAKLRALKRNKNKN